MLSLSNMMGPEMMHTIVDAFVEGKKAQVKQRLRESMEIIVDDLFGELMGQLKQMLLPARGGQPTGMATLSTPTSQAIQSVNSETLDAVSRSASKKTDSNAPLLQPPIFAVKSAPKSTSTNTAGGGKRPLPPDLSSSDSNDPVAFGEHSSDDLMQCGDMETITSIAKKRAKTQPNDSETEASGNQVALQDNSNWDNLGQLSSDNDDTLGKYVCSTLGCGKRFKKTNHLKDHERRHSGVNPFVCKFPGCSYSGRKRCTAIRHINTIHLKSLEPGDEGNDPKKYLEVNDELLN